VESLIKGVVLVLILSLEIMSSAVGGSDAGLRLYLIPEENVTSISVTGTPSNPFASSSLGYLVITPNLWNLNASSSSGETTISYDPSSGSLNIQANFSRFNLIQPLEVGAYSELIYGYKPFGTSTPEAENFTFPVQIDKMGTLLSFINYTLNSFSPYDALFDWTYDLWVTTSPHLTQGPQRGDLEVMIWYFYHNQIPAGSLEGYVKLPTWINGTKVDSTFQVWLSNQERISNSQTIITFRITNPIPDGQVGVNITAFIYQAIHILTFNYSWNYTYLTSKYLNGIEFGTEYGNVQSHNISLNWTIHSMFLEVPTSGKLNPLWALLVIPMVLVLVVIIRRR